jgi:polyisoprenoid-binding protein YceI
MKFRLASLAFAAAALVLPGAATAADYVIDTKGHASINFKISHLGFSFVTGRFNTFTGTFSYDEAKPEASKVAVEIDVASIDTNQAERDKHVRSADFLDAAKFPKATFVSKSVKSSGPGKATVTGDLTLHGVTKPVTIEAEYVGGGDDPWGGHRQGFRGNTTLTLADFGVDTSPLGPTAGAVELSLNVEGLRK